MKELAGVVEGQDKALTVGHTAGRLKSSKPQLAAKSKKWRSITEFVDLFSVNKQWRCREGSLLRQYRTSLCEKSCSETAHTGSVSMH